VTTCASFPTVSGVPARKSALVDSWEQVSSLALRGRSQHSVSQPSQLPHQTHVSAGG